MSLKGQAPEIRTQVSLARHTTLGVGGNAAYWVDCANDQELAEALAWAARQRQEIFVLGGGSNLLVADRGFDGLVIRPTNQDFEVTAGSAPSSVLLRVGAGWVWDDLVARTVAETWAGLECLSGIPGNTGAAPIQNIGAYGQEVSQTLRRVRVIDRQSCSFHWLTSQDAGFGYRHSRFKADWRGRFVVTAIELELQIRDQGTLRYPGLRAHLGLKDQDPSPDLKTTREAVLDIRRQKSMVIDSSDANSRSAGSFFINPLVSPAVASEVQERVHRLGIERAMPSWPSEGRVKLSAAWLIEEAGFKRGHVHGQAGLSSRHTLALINRGRARAEEILDLSWQIRDRVYQEFGVELRPEPVFLNLPDRPLV